MPEKQPNLVDEQRNGDEPCDALAEAEALRGQMQSATSRAMRWPKQRPYVARCSPR
jgi:hypothetical protein